MKTLVTGGAGLIGSALVDRLLADGHEVIAYDNFSTGQRRFLESAGQHSRFTLVEGDILDDARLRDAVFGVDLVFHLAANADVRFGPDHPRRDLEQNTIGTYGVLEAMRLSGVKRIVFSSTGSIYGEPGVFPTPEDAPFPVQTSLYGASKLGAEGLIAAYAEAFGMTAWIFRFVSLLGERYSHGHVFDFCRSLRRDPTRLHVLGNGRQRKSYLYVHDCVEAICLALQRTTGRVNILNLGTDEYCEVNDSIGWITQYLGVRPVLSYTGTDRGWIGDSPFIFLDCTKIRALGWRPRLTIRQAILRTVEYLLANPWLLDAADREGVDAPPGRIVNGR